MIFDDAIYIFEDKSLFDSFHEHTPDSTLFDWRSLLSKWTEERLLTEEEEAKIFESLLEPKFEHRKENYLYTLKKLREALVLSHDDLNFCFSLLPQTPKHQELHQLAHRYLDSPLASDWTGQVWKVIEALRSGTLKIPDVNLTLVWGKERSHLFGEFAQAITSCATKSVRLIEPWELENQKKWPTLWIETSFGYRRLAERVRHLMDQGRRERDIEISVQLSPGARTLLKASLSRLQIPFRDAEEKAVAPLSWIEKVRTDRRKPVRDRLDLIHRLREHGIGNEIQEQTLKLLKDRMLLTPEDTTFLESAISKDEKTSSVPREGIRLGAFYPISPVKYHLALVDKSLLVPERFPFCLEENEIDTLNLQGFPIPRTRDLRNRQLEFLKHFTQRSSSHRILFDGSQELLDLKRRKWRYKKVSPTRSEGPADTLFPLEKAPLSATQLETYAQCPAKYFYASKMRLRPSTRKWEDRYALVFGTAVHRVLETALQKDLNRVPESSELRALFHESLKWAEPTLTESHPMYFMLHQSFSRIADSFPVLEREFRARFRTKPAYFEKEFEMEIGGYALRGKVDRIDQTETGQWVVLDYKTGKVDFSPNQLESGNNFQALLYFLSARKLGATTGILFYDLKKGEVKRGVVSAELIDDETRKSLVRGHALKQERLDELLQMGEAHVQNLSSSILEGRFHPTPDAATCEFCEFGTLCRGAHRYA